MTLSSRIAVMDRGRIVQVGTPDEIYERPRDRFVAGFIGAINMFEGAARRVGDRVEIRAAGAGATITAVLDDHAPRRPWRPLGPGTRSAWRACTASSRKR